MTAGRPLESERFRVDVDDVDSAGANLAAGRFVMAGDTS
jgi:hypothetical protein